jgi:polysaccharide pyruvyl transferase CsaB
MIALVKEIPVTWPLQPLPRLGEIPTAPMKALLMGYYGMRNLGDEMMLFCLRPWLESQSFQLTVLSERPQDVARTHGLPAVENTPLLGEWAWRTSWFRGRALRLVRTIARCDALIVGGGDLIRDDLGWRTFFFTVEKLILAIILKKKVYLVNSGIGEPRTYYGQVILKWVLRRCQRIFVRDLRSLDICKSFGIQQNVMFAPDIVLSLPGLLEQHTRAFADAPAMNRYIAVCLRQDANAFQRYGMTEERIRTLAASLDALIRHHGLDVVFIPFQDNPENGKGDNQMHEKVAEAMLHSDRVRVCPWTDDFTKVAHYIANAQFVIAMRLHAAVLAVAYGRPSVLLPCDVKIREFGDLMKIYLRLEAPMLDNPSFVIAQLERAWIDSQNPETKNYGQYCRKSSRDPQV